MKEMANSYIKTVTGPSLCTQLLTHGFSNYSFFVVGDDAANKIRVGVPQRGHELSE